MATYLGDSGGMIGKGSVPKQITVQSAIEDMDPALGRLESLADRARTCADRVTGPRPSAVSEEQKPSDVPNGLIASAQYRRSRLVRTIDELESEIQRMEGSLS